MIEVTVESIRVSLINQQRLVVLREDGTQRYLPIWIGPFEAEAITMGLQGTDAGRPLTHDLLRNVLDELGAVAKHIHINALQDETFFAQVVLSMNGDSFEIDSRPSDAIALAVRLGVPIYVSDDVMDQAGQLPATEIEGDDLPASGGIEDQLGVFRDFVEGLDLDDITGEA
jgi:hypothetical protein